MAPACRPDQDPGPGMIVVCSDGRVQSGSARDLVLVAGTGMAAPSKQVPLIRSASMDRHLAGPGRRWKEGSCRGSRPSGGVVGYGEPGSSGPITVSSRSSATQLDRRRVPADQARVPHGARAEGGELAAPSSVVHEAARWRAPRTGCAGGRCRRRVTFEPSTRVDPPESLPAAPSKNAVPN